MTATTGRRRIVGGAIAAVLVLGVGATALVVTTGSGSSAAADNDNGTVTVTGRGVAAGAPDILRVTFALTNRADDVSTALERANANVRAVQGVLRKHEVADRDVRTDGLEVGSTYSRTNPGFRATQTLVVTLRDLKAAGRVIADAAAAGGNATRINSVSYGIEDRAALLDAARDAAYAEAKAKAERYAALTGRPLGVAKSVNENVNEDYGRYAYAAKAAATTAGAADSPVPLAEGAQQVSVTSKVVWTLG